MDIQIGDVLIMKKPHPCGENRFTVGRVGMDFRIRCVGCGRQGGKEHQKGFARRNRARAGRTQNPAFVAAFPIR